MSIETRLVAHAHPLDLAFTRATREADGHVHGIQSWLADDTLWNTDSVGVLHRHHMPNRIPGTTSLPVVNRQRHEENGA